MIAFFLNQKILQLLLKITDKFLGHPNKQKQAHKNMVPKNLRLNPRPRNSLSKHNKDNIPKITMLKRITIR